jgi:hypothetical protein
MARRLILSIKGDDNVERGSLEDVKIRVPTMLCNLVLVNPKAASNMCLGLKSVEQ